MPLTITDFSHLCSHCQKMYSSSHTLPSQPPPRFLTFLLFLSLCFTTWIRAVSSNRDTARMLICLKFPPSGAGWGMAQGIIKSTGCSCRVHHPQCGPEIKSQGIWQPFLASGAAICMWLTGMQNIHMYKANKNIKQKFHPPNEKLNYLFFFFSLFSFIIIS